MKLKSSKRNDDDAGAAGAGAAVVTGAGATIGGVGLAAAAAVAVDDGPLNSFENAENNFVGCLPVGAEATTEGALTFEVGDGATTGSAIDADDEEIG